MKQGGVGYVQPTPDMFPRVDETNRFIREAGAVPTYAWLDGTSAGERAIDELLDTVTASGVAALNIIPDRNFTAGVNDEKLANLRDIVERAEERGLPLVVGTEMNSPDQRFVDDFASGELAPLVPAFLKGAHIIYAHSALQRACGLGYLSEWASRAFKHAADKNEFFRAVGETLAPGSEHLLSGLDRSASPGEILRALKNTKKP